MGLHKVANTTTRVCLLDGRIVRLWSIDWPLRLSSVLGVKFTHGCAGKLRIRKALRGSGSYSAGMSMRKKANASLGVTVCDADSRAGVSGGSRALDVCAGDADALCAVLQWRLHEPKAAQMVSGPLCATASLGRFQLLPGDDVLVCNVPFNSQPAPGMSGPIGNARVQYLDCRGQAPGDSSPYSKAGHSTDAKVCTSLLVNHLLQGKFGGWALVGAYGSQVQQGVNAHALQLGFSAGARKRLQRLGEVITYNAEVIHPRYLYAEPATLYARLLRYDDPLEFLQSESLADELDELRQSDLQTGLAWKPYWRDAHASVYVLPDEAWAARVARYLKSRLAILDPERAIAVLSPAGTGSYRAAVQPGLMVRNAVTPKKWLIEHLPMNEVDNFVGAFSASGWGGLRTPVFRAWI